MYENQSLIFVDLDKLKNNFFKIKEKTNGAKVGIVLKANAYGLGACTVAEFYKNKVQIIFVLQIFQKPWNLEKRELNYLS